MTDCIFCTVPDLLCKTTPAYLIGPLTIPEKSRFLSYSVIDIIPIISKDVFSTMTIFTPGARLALSLKDAAELIAHRKAWLEIMQNKSHYSVIFDSEIQLNDMMTHNRIQNLQLPKDWDIVSISDTQYVLNKRAAKILVESTMQFHANVATLLDSIKILKVIKIR
jgi:hypothetical protein